MHSHMNNRPATAAKTSVSEASPSLITLSAYSQNLDAGKSNPLTKALGVYNSLLEERPLLTKMVTTAIIGAMGDILIQLVKSKSNAELLFDVKRTVIFAAVGGLYCAPFLHQWFNILNKIQFPKTWGKLKKALAMVAIDTTLGKYFFDIASPCMCIIYFLFTHSPSPFPVSGVFNGGFFFAFEFVRHVILLLLLLFIIIIIIIIIITIIIIIIFSIIIIIIIIMSQNHRFVIT